MKHTLTVPEQLEVTLRDGVTVVTFDTEPRPECVADILAAGVLTDTLVPELADALLLACTTDDMDGIDPLSRIAIASRIRLEILKRQGKVLGIKAVGDDPKAPAPAEKKKAKAK